MDFGDILDRWERERGKQGGADGKRDGGKDRSDMDRWIDRYSPDEPKPEDAGVHDNVLSARARRRLRAMAPQRSLDLHGKTAAEARALVHGFLRQAHSDGLEKVLIVHGKGLHSEGGDSVLKRTVQDVLRESRLAGETGVPPRELGGSGGTWVILRYRSR